MATSREALRLQGEHEYPVHALSVPVRAEQRSFDATQAEAVQLFIERARAVKTSFTVDLTSIYNKLGVSSRVAATRFAIEHKLI